MRLTELTILGELASRMFPNLDLDMAATRDTSQPSSPSSPAAGAPITRAQTFPFNFHIKTKSPRPGPGPVQEERPSNLQLGTDALPKISKQGKRTASEPSVLPSSPKSAKRPSDAASRVSSTSHYGRHANEWLFGNFSVRETVKGVWKGHDGKGK